MPGKAQVSLRFKTAWHLAVAPRRGFVIGTMNRDDSSCKPITLQNWLVHTPMHDLAIHRDRKGMI
jgi:hypothetical protein